MSEEITSEEGKKIKIRPRQITRKDEEKEGGSSNNQDAEQEKPKLKATGKPFPAKLSPLSAEPPPGEAEAALEPGKEGSLSASAQENDAKSEARKKKIKKQRPFFAGLRNVLKSLPRRKVGLLPVVLICLPVIAILLNSAWRSGFSTGVREADRAAAMEGLQLPSEVSGQLDAALMALRAGDAASAEKTLRQLDESERKYPSLSYLAALAAMQNGDIGQAERKVKESIAKRERISDALALQSVLETQKAADPTRWKMGDPQKRSEALLRQAILADAANPYPHFELATLLRYQGRRDEAMQEIKAAKARLNPMDSHLVMDVTLALMELEALPEAEIPKEAPQTDDVRKLFAAAYGSMRLGNFPQAALLLQRCRELLSIDVFDYLVNDPLLRKFAQREELKGFYGN